MESKIENVNNVNMVKQTCEPCNYSTSNDSHYKRHCSSKKHLLKTGKITTSVCTKCSKEKQHSEFYAGRKVCKECCKIAVSKPKTDYTISGTSVLSATSLGSGVVSSSLTSVGTLDDLTVSGSICVNGGELELRMSDGANCWTMDVTGATTTDQDLKFVGDGDQCFRMGVDGNFEVCSNDGVYKIDDVSVLSSTSLGSGVVSSSLTSVGTLNNLSVGAGVMDIWETFQTIKEHDGTVSYTGIFKDAGDYLSTDPVLDVTGNCVIAGNCEITGDLKLTNINLNTIDMVDSMKLNNLTKIPGNPEGKLYQMNGDLYFGYNKLTSNTD